MSNAKAIFSGEGLLPSTDLWPEWLHNIKVFLAYPLYEGQNTTLIFVTVSAERRSITGHVEMKYLALFLIRLTYL